jgi:Domain of unknown function (DUF4129)
MTSRQPEAESSGSVLHRDPSRQLLPLVLLILLGLTGLSGVLTPPRWDGPLQRDRLIVGLALEVVLVVLFVITNKRQRAATRLARLRALGQGTAPATGAATTEMAAKLRAVLLFVLGGGIAAAAVVMLTNLKLPAGKSVKLSRPSLPKGKRDLRGHHRHPDFHFPLTALLYGLLVVLLIAAVLLSIWWARRQRPSVAARPDGFIAEDPESLREAVESGRTALRTFDDARAAIIACYVAMEASLAQRGAARGAADTPDELLARATEQGVVRGTAAARLTALFYEARFSSHPLDPGQRDAAEQALDELAAAIDAAQSAPAIVVDA